MALNKVLDTMKNKNKIKKIVSLSYFINCFMSGKTLVTMCLTKPLNHEFILKTKKPLAPFCLSTNQF